MLRNRIAVARRLKQTELAVSPVSRIPTLSAPKTDNCPKKVRRGGEGPFTCCLRIPMHPHSRVHRDGRVQRRSGRPWRGGNRGRVLTQILRCGHFGNKCYSLLRKWRRPPRPVFPLIPFAVSPPPSNLPAFFFVPATPPLLSLLFCCLTKCAPCSVIAIARIRLHIRRRPDVLSKYDTAQTERASHLTRTCPSSPIPLRTGRRRRSIGARVGGVPRAQNRDKCCRKRSPRTHPRLHLPWKKTK